MIRGAVNPRDHFDQPMWCVYGPDCFPTLICCKVVEGPSGYGPTILGYSIYRRKPGFRTIGQNLDKYFSDMQKTYGWDPNPQFFVEQPMALEYLRILTECKVP